jgi:hypothetical protein
MTNARWANGVNELTDLLAAIRPVIARSVALQDDAFDERWNRIEPAFRAWLAKLPAELSDGTRNLALLEQICRTFDTIALKDNPDIQSILLHGFPNVGEFVQQRPGATRYRIVRRGVTERFALQFTVVDGDGRLIIHDFHE